MDLLQGLAGASLAHLILVAFVGFAASFLGGVTGYGNSALLPLVLMPVTGPEPLVPIISIVGIFNNFTRVIVFRRYIDFSHAWIVLAISLPACAFGAYIYTKLTGPIILCLIGAMLALSVPLRRLLRKRNVMLDKRGLAGGSAIFGFLTGTTTGAGVILMSLLMAVGMSGIGVLATDAVISTVTGLTRMSVYWASGAMTQQVIAFGLLIGLVSLPGTFAARAFVERLPVHVHTAFLDAIVILGSAVMIVQAARQFW
jgi:uncharacterized membrane protein YfcA